MANSSESSSDLADINEKLYTDSYYLYLKNKKNNLPEASNALRDLIRQVNIHSGHLNISESNAKELSDEFHVEYYDVVDSINRPFLLPTCGIETPKSESSHDHETGVLMRSALDELNLYLNSLKINLPPVTSSGSLFEPKVTSNVKINQTVPNSTSNQRTNFSSSTLLELPSKSYVKNTTNTNFNGPKLYLNNSNLPQKSSEHKTNIKYNLNSYNQTRSYGTGLANKRTAEENGNSNSGPSSKRHNNYRNPKLPSQPKSVPPKACGSGFISASSMYRNPLKKSDGDKLAESTSPEASQDSEINNHESLKRFDKKIVDVIFNEIMDFSPNIKWSDIAGLDFVKTTIQEIVIWPLLRPDIFTGLRAPPRGILLFGPPGTGKTLIGKCIATESNSTFFCISASSLASKWVGESEQLVRALFTVARLNQPAVIFVDEIDSLLSQRSDKDQDFSRKLKTEFLVQFDGAKTSSEERVLVVGATNRPHELDEAARRRFVKRLYVPLPEASARRQIVHKLLTDHQHDLSECDFTKICDETKGYSGSDVAHLCKEAAMGPIRSIGPENIKTVSLDQVRPINLSDFLDALRQVRASVAQDDLNYYLEWNKKFGSFGV